MTNYDNNYNNRNENNNVGFKELAILVVFVTIIILLIVGVVYSFIISNKDKKRAENSSKDLGVSYYTNNQNTDSENKEIANKTSDSKNTINNINPNIALNKPYGEQIARFAREFYKDYKDKVKFGYDTESRERAYWFTPGNDGKYTIDCIGLVNLVVHEATGFELTKEEMNQGFVTPKLKNHKSIVIEPFELQDVIYDFHSGDVLVVDGSQNVVIYIGDNEILEITENGLQIASVHKYKYFHRAQIVT